MRHRSADGDRCAARGDHRRRSRGARVGDRRLAGHPATRGVRHLDAPRLLGDLHVHGEQSGPATPTSRLGDGVSSGIMTGNQLDVGDGQLCMGNPDQNALDRAVRQHQRQPRVRVRRRVPRPTRTPPGTSASATRPGRQPRPRSPSGARSARQGRPRGRARHPGSARAAGTARSTRRQRRTRASPVSRVSRVSPARRGRPARRAFRVRRARSAHRARRRAPEGDPGAPGLPRPVPDRRAAQEGLPASCESGGVSIVSVGYLIVNGEVVRIFGQPVIIPTGYAVVCNGLDGAPRQGRRRRQGRRHHDDHPDQ